MPTIDLPLGTVKYRADGPPDSAEPPVVFVHPILTNGDLWAPVARRLAAHGVRSYSPDWPLGSHTIAQHRDAELSPAAVAHMVCAFLAALDLHEVTLVGNDTGGALVQFVLASGEPRVTRAVLMNCDAFDSFPPFPFNAMLGPLKSPAVARVMANLMSWKPLRQSKVGFGLLAHHIPAELTGDWMEPARTNPDVRRDLSALIRSLDPRELLEITNSLGSVTAPVTILWGMADRVFKPSLGRRLADACGNAEWVEVPGARAFLALDAPDHVSAAIRAIADRPLPAH